MRKTVLLDRDGVIVEDIGYHYKIEDFKLIPNAVEGLKLLKDYKLVVITNQSGIGRGYFKFDDFEKFNNHLLKELEKYNIKIAKTYLCPHKPEDSCECRKPKIKLLKDAEEEMGIDLKKSFFIGDRKKDIDMGHSAGCKSILVLTGHGAKAKQESKANYVANDLLDAAKWIIEND
ncbi:HAD family hydrolase [Candidatus Woesearchaeota archaeon]|nr:HAD family hydrolase [Candidatus Woesearchaeota archaeon]